MERVATLFSEGSWYKGNTHTHSNLSDGNLSPRELAEHYRQNGYNFLALTDHCVYGIHEELQTDDFLIFPGTELDVLADGKAAFCHHLIGIGIPEKNKFAHGHRFEYDHATTTANELISLLREGGNEVICAHPNWSHVQFEEFDTIKGTIGMEIYNNTCQVIFGCGESESYFDRMLWNGRKSWCFASDDTHQNGDDMLGGFICVKAKALTHRDLMDAILAGSFYASRGPEIKDFYVSGDQAYVECSPCCSVAFLSDNFFGKAYVEKEGTLTSAQYAMNTQEAYIRVVCQDAYGRKAWSQPIWMR